MKKVLSLVLALTMILSSFSFAFAFDDVDADNASLTTSVDALSSLGIINGYEDGSFKPEKVVTRAEMAKMLIVALGYESIANDTPSFTDCQKHWAKGYISLANSLGVVNGRGNGIFDPDATVTYQEAAVMMLRALGYSDSAINGGKSDSYNAGNYKVTALKLGLFNNITVGDFGKGANRGDIACMLFNDLTNAMVEINPTTGLAQKVVADATATPVVYETLISKLATRENLEVTADVVAAQDKVDLSEYLFETVVAYKMNGKVVFVEKSNNNSVNGDIQAINSNVITVNKVAYTLPTTAINVSENGTVANKVVAGSDLAVGNTVKVVYDKDKNVTALVVEKIDVTKKVLNTYIAGKTRFEAIDLPLDKAGKVDFSKVTVVGDAKALEDIQVNDIIEVVLTKDSSSVVTAAKFYVTRNTIEGKIDKVANGVNYVNGVAQNVGSLLVGSDALALGKSGVFYLNKSGAVVFFAEGKQSVSYNYAIVTGVANGTVAADAFDASKKSIAVYPKVKLVEMDGTVKIYELGIALNADGSVAQVTGFNVEIAETTKLNASITAVDGAINTSNYVVEYALDANGRVSSVKAVTVIDNTTGEAVATNSTNFLADANTVVLNYASASKAYSVTSIDKLNSKVNYYAVGDSFKWNLLVVVDGLATTKTDKVYGVVTATANVLNAKGTEVQEITVLVNGKTETYLTSANNTIAAEKVNTVVSLVFSVDNVVTGLEPELTQIGTTTTVSAISGSRIALSGSDVSYAFSSDVVVYKQNANDTVTVGDMADVQFAIGETNTVSLYDKNGDGVVDTIFLSK